MSDIIILSDDEEPQAKKPKLDDNSESVVISDEETITASDENLQTNNNNNNIVPPQPSISSPLQRKFNYFLDLCAESLKGSNYEDRLLPKFPKIRKQYDALGPEHAETNIFQRLLDENIAITKLSAAQAVISFNNIYKHLSDVLSESTTEVPINYKKIKLLNKTMNLLRKKIKYLESCEVNFDDEENSAYMKISRYNERLNKVYQKYCKLLNTSHHKGRLAYDKLVFVSSDYNEINRAITKNYYKNKSFPTYYEIEKWIKKCVNKNNLRLSEGEIRIESECCFKKLGEMLKKRRQHELYESHSSYLTNDDDPGTSNPELNATLEKNKQIYNEKMNKVIEKYTKLQDNYKDEELSEDTDDSHYEDESDKDNDDDDNNDKD